MKVIVYSEDPDFEPVELKMNKDAPRICYWCACDIIEGRWPEAEEVIKKDPEYAYAYAYDAIKGRWPEAEKFIIESSKASKYIKICEYDDELAKLLLSGYPQDLYIEYCLSTMLIHVDKSTLISFMSENHNV